MLPDPSESTNEEPRETIVPLENIEVLMPPDDSLPRPIRRVAPRFRPRRKVPLILFVLTCLSTFLAGGMFMTVGLPAFAIFHPEVVSHLVNQVGIETFLWRGFCYAGPVILILLCHEMGHYLQAVRNRVPATLPYFIPMPITPLGTMGAVILQSAGVADRRATFDIAVSGPLAGLLPAIPILYFGVVNSTTSAIPPGYEGVIFGDPLILKWMVALVHGPLPAGHEVDLNPLLFAGWVGIFITALNLIPIGQLDGGHILYTLIGRRAHVVAYALLGAAVGMMIWYQYPAYALMVVLLFMMGPRHPPTTNDAMPLGILRTVIGWLTLSFIVFGFTPTPIVPVESRPPERSVPTAEYPELTGSIPSFNLEPPPASDL